MRRPDNIAGDPDAHRFRSARSRGTAAVRRWIITLAAPRALSTGDQAAHQSSGGGAGGSSGAGLPFTPSIPIEGHCPAGDPATGKRHKIIGHYRVGSTKDLIA